MLRTSPMDTDQALYLYRCMVMARSIDELERAFCQRGEAFFTIGGAGHGGSAAIAPLLKPYDWLSPHYRDRALILARGVGPEDFFHALFAKDASHHRGRQLPGFFSDPELKILPMPIPVGNGALPSVGVATTLRDNGDAIVYCGIGDGTSQQGEWMEAVAHAVRERLPVLFVVHDNHYAISTRTPGKTFFSLPHSEATHWLGLPIHRVDGTSLEGCHESLTPIVSAIRETREPALVLLDMERLCDHSNADDQTLYRDDKELEAVSTRDPITRLEESLRQRGVAEETLREIREGAKVEVHAAAERSQQSPDPDPEHAPRVKRPIGLIDVPINDAEVAPADVLTMAEAIRETLRHRLDGDPRVILFGEDIEDPKGDVFKVTKTLSTLFPGRVRNSPLSESTILGVSLGQALAGKRPVCFLQFADFFPLVFNQLYSEVASIYWRSAGRYEAPLILMVTCGGYRPGLGPFHAASMEAIAAHIPGIDVLLPSNAADAAGLLNSAFDSGRPTVFFYPKKCAPQPGALQPRLTALPPGTPGLCQADTPGPRFDRGGLRQYGSDLRARCRLVRQGVRFHRDTGPTIHLAMGRGRSARVGCQDPSVASGP